MRLDDPANETHFHACEYMPLHLKGMLGAETEECIFEHTRTGVWKETSDSLVFGEPVLLTEEQRGRWLGPLPAGHPAKMVSFLEGYFVRFYRLQFLSFFETN